MYQKIQRNVLAPSSMQLRYNQFTGLTRLAVRQQDYFSYLNISANKKSSQQVLEVWFTTYSSQIKRNIENFFLDLTKFEGNYRMFITPQQQNKFLEEEKKYSAT